VDDVGTAECQQDGDATEEGGAGGVDRHRAVCDPFVIVELTVAWPPPGAVNRHVVAAVGESPRESPETFASLRRRLEGRPFRHEGDPHTLADTWRQQKPPVSAGYRPGSPRYRTV
jgi:hypothetical protein